MNSQILPMKQDHLEAVLRIEALSFAVPWTREFFEVELGNDYARNWILLENGEALGYLMGWLLFEEFHIGNLAVSPNHRRKGIAQQLLAWSLSEALREGAESAALEVRASNIAARKLYAAFDFKPIGVRRGYYEKPVEDAIILIKELGEPQRTADPQ